MRTHPCTRTIPAQKIKKYCCTLMLISYTLLKQAFLAHFYDPFLYPSKELSLCIFSSLHNFIIVEETLYDQPVLDKSLRFALVFLPPTLTQGACIKLHAWILWKLAPPLHSAENGLTWKRWFVVQVLKGGKGFKWLMSFMETPFNFPGPVLAVKNGSSLPSFFHSQKNLKREK
ncbi:hypothetical protein AB205_0033130 [Aquarana catesbeiana]|uniref:Uncharacterized protein n=1 Tax=Aquarana catesbeiana TaxID=8400 RepID=A0A2G9NNY6_AQUCT|nr:hypothetical protein AB205_0033130 [Aquarana catesbeiana]